MRKMRYFVSKIYEPEPCDSAYQWCIIDRMTDKVVAAYAKRSQARIRCRDVYNHPDYHGERG